MSELNGLNGLNGLVITGSGVVSAAGIGMDAVSGVLARGESAPADVTALYAEVAMPEPFAYANVDFDARALLGRKGTTFLDRTTALAVVACGQAIEDSGVVVDDETRHRVGVALGTTTGSFRSSSDYSRDTMVQERPYLVNPMLFPNTIMNCAAGQCAIRYGLRGVNSTVDGGRVGFHGALRYAANVLRRGYADVMLVGATEEFTPHAAWAHRGLERAGLPGEASAVFVLEAANGSTGRAPLAEVASVVSAFHPGGAAAGLSTVLAATVQRALERAQVSAADVWLFAAGEVPDAGADDVEADVVAKVFGSAGVERLRVRHLLGDCGAATGALHLAAFLARHRADPGPGERIGVLASWSPDGAVAAAVVKGRDGVRVGRG
jgi:3-oxoacyl-[acyl-carrier-protein] synthase II